MAKLPSKCVCWKLRGQGPSLGQARTLSPGIRCTSWSSTIPPHYYSEHMGEEEEKEMEEKEKKTWILMIHLTTDPVFKNSVSPGTKDWRHRVWSKATQLVQRVRHNWTTQHTQLVKSISRSQGQNPDHRPVLRGPWEPRPPPPAHVSFLSNHTQVCASKLYCLYPS